VKDLPALVAHLRRDEAIEGELIGLRGGSMGGYIALSAVAQDLPVRAVLSICGAADYPNTFGSQVRGENQAQLPPLGHLGLSCQFHHPIIERVERLGPDGVGPALQGAEIRH